MSMSWWQRSKLRAELGDTPTPPGVPPDIASEGSGGGAAEDPAASSARGSREKLRERARRRLLGAQSRRLFLQVGLPWGAALLVGLVSVLYADWSTDVSNAFL